MVAERKAWSRVGTKSWTRGLKKAARVCDEEKMQKSKWRRVNTLKISRLVLLGVIIDPKVHMHDHSALCESIHNTEHPS